MCKSEKLKDLKIRHIAFLNDYGYDYKYKDIIIKADEEARKEKVGLYQ